MSVYRLDTARFFYSDKKEIEKLEKLGFEFKKCGDDYVSYSVPTIELEGLDDLQHFITDYGRVIIDHKTITIYDDYVE